MEKHAPGRAALAAWLSLAGCATDETEAQTIGPVTVGDATTSSTGSDDSSSASDTQATQCGDGVVQQGEDCDGMDLDGASCEALGFEDGVLACGPSCTIITNACWRCGDGTLAAPEACDGELLRGESCATQGYASGTLSCNAECSGYDASMCVPLATCGNGVIDGAEQCDGADLGAATCQSQGFDTGTLSCHMGCTFDTSGCGYNPIDCGQQGDICQDDDDCCPAGVGNNFAGKCFGFLCT